MTDVHSQCLCSCNLSPHSVKAVCWKSRVSLYTQDFTMLLFSCVLTSCCRLSFHIKFYSYLFLLFDLIEFQLSRKRCGIGLSCNYIETRKLNVNNFFFAYSNFFSFFFSSYLPCLIHYLKPWGRFLVSGAIWRCVPFLYWQAEQTYLVGSTYQQAGSFQ